MCEIDDGTHLIWFEIDGIDWVERLISVRLMPRRDTVFRGYAWHYSQ